MKAKIMKYKLGICELNIIENGGYPHVCTFCNSEQGKCMYMKIGFKISALIVCPKNEPFKNTRGKTIL